MSSGPVLIGGSGATLVPAVVKVGVSTVGLRAASQGAWLAAHQDIKSLPRVYANWSYGYAMEPLDQIDWETVDWGAHVFEVVGVLASQFWSRPAEVAIDLDAHLRFVQERCEQLPEAWSPLHRWAKDVEWTSPVLTHGDPTFDNQCRRSDGTLVLIDPNPSTVNTPSVREADLAHLCQSLHGYESIKYGRPVPTVGPEFFRSFLTDTEWDLVRYLTAVKFVRILTYETTHKAEFSRIATELIAAR